MLLNRATALSLTLVTLAACGGSTSGPSGPNNQTNMSARIDGALWQPDLAASAVNAAPGLYSITGFRTTTPNNYTMVLSLYNITGPGTYPLGVVTTVFGGSAVLSQPPSNGWSTPLNGTSGQINITTLTATRMVATFNFDTEPLQAGSPGSPRVTDGTLDIPVTGTGGFALANQGSKLSGNIGGNFVASGVSGSLSTAGVNGPVFTLVATNGTRNLTISISNMTGPGTYALQAATPVRSIQSSGMPGNQTATWGSQIAGGSGSVTISIVTAARIIGSFTGTLAPFSAGGAVGNLAVSGTFELARLF